MSNTPVQEPSAQALSSGSGQTLPSRPFQPISDPSASKRVCFYKSGDYTFSGHRMVINARTFKTFDALLDALSKKVPLPFGVRTITTPRGTHLVKALDDLHDGGSYVCSDQRRVKPLNLEEVNRRQVPWNTTRSFSAGRRKLQRLQFGRRNDVTTRSSKATERVAIRTPKRLEVIKNRDPNIKRTIVLQRRTAPTFDALLDYLSQILQFPVLKLFAIDGRRVDGLAALILCSGVVVAAGNEPFRLANYNFHKVSQAGQAMYMDAVEPSMLQQPRALNNKSFSSGRGSRNFSLSSERYIVNQINKSRYGSTNGHYHRSNRSFETEANHHRTSLETTETARMNNEHASIIPQDDDIEKSFRINQDGSMTVEMKVRLTIKEEEMLHWTTTLSRTCLSKRTVCASISDSGKSSTDSNNAVAKHSSSASGDELKEGNRPSVDGKGVKFNDEPVIGRSRSGFKRSPTPGAQQVKRASVESIKMMTESGVKESTLGHYSYMNRTADGGTTEGYRVVRHSSSSNRPIPKPRKTPSAGAMHNGSHSSIRSSGVAEVLKIQNDGMEVTETVMHIYESQGGYDNYLANEEYSADGGPSYSSTPAIESKASLDSPPPSSSNDCDIDFSGQQPTTDSQQRQKEEMLSLSSEPISQTQEMTNPTSAVTKREARTKAKVKTPTREKKTTIKSVRNPQSLTSSSSLEKKPKDSRLINSKNGGRSSTEKLSSSASLTKKSLSSSESAKSVQKRNVAVKPQIKKAITDAHFPRKEQALIVNSINVRRSQSLRHNLDKAAAKDNSHNVNTPTARPQMKKNISDILQPKKSLLPARKAMTRPKSMSDHKLPPPNKPLELSESLSTPSFKPSLSEIHQYVENWLEKVSPDPVPYTEDSTTDESKTKVVFQIGADSESDEKTDGQTTQDEISCPAPGDVKKSASCLTVPQCHADPTLLYSEQYVKGLCVSMPSVRVDPTQKENIIRPHKSVEALSPAADTESSSSNFLSPQAKIKPVLRQIYSSFQNIRGASDTNTTSNLEKTTSLPDFPTQVASVFGSSCKAFLSFLSVMTLRDNARSDQGVPDQSTSDSEAMLMMQSLQKISAIEDAEEQRASLTDLQSRASSQLRARWKDFQILRERLESEPLSPRVSETEFALDVVSEGGDVFDDHLGIDELMEQMNMPADLRAEISSTIQQSRFFYPVEESTFVETEKHQSDSEEEVEKFVEEGNDETEQTPEPEGAIMMTEPEKELLEGKKPGNNVKDQDVSQREKDEQVKESDEEQDEENDREKAKGKEDEGMKERSEESEAEVEENPDGKRKEEGEAEEGSEEEEESILKFEEQSENDMTEDEEKEGGLAGKETEVIEATDEGSVDDQESDVEETDDREGDGETEDEETVKSEGDETEKEETESIEVDGERGREENEEVEEEEEKEEAEETEEEAKGEGGADLESEEDDKEQEEVDEEREEAENEEEEIDEETEVEENVEEVKREDEVKEESDEEDEEGMEMLRETEDEENVGEDDGAKEEEVKKEDEVNEETEEEDKESLELLRETQEGENHEEEAGEMGEQVEVESVKEKEDDSFNEEEEETKDAIKEVDLEEAEEDVEDVTEEKEEVEDVIEVVSEKNSEREDEEEAEEGGETFRNIDEEDKCDECGESSKNLQKTEDSFEEESVLEEVIKGTETEEEKQDSEFDVEEESDDAGDKSVPEEASYVEQQSSFEEDANVEAKIAVCNSESLSVSSEVQCADDKGDGTDTVNEFETDGEEQSDGLPHPVEISQELLDFVNSALQSASLVFTYDAHGKVRIEPDNSRGVKANRNSNSRRIKDSSYGVKCLPSPSCSELSDYRPETSESGGYQSQESVDIISESGEEGSQRQFPVCKRQSNISKCKLAVKNNSREVQNSKIKTGGSFSSRASKEDLSYFSAGSSQKADLEAAAEAKRGMSVPSEKDSKDGVLIDQGRWLLKENHLIRASPPVSMGMYNNLDSSSSETSHSRSSADSPPDYKTKQNLLAALSSSELEELAKPRTPKCTYYNMSHGSDSDPFLDDSSYKSGKGANIVKGRGIRVGPTVNTSHTWANKNGSLSSFASVEFNIPDRRVHPEGEPSSVTMARRTSGGRGRAVQAQDSIETMHLRCGRYCPIL